MCIWKCSLLDKCSDITVCSDLYPEPLSEYGQQFLSFKSEKVNIQQHVSF